MTIVNRLVTCGTVATQVVGADNMPHEVHLHNMTKSSNEYILELGVLDIRRND